VRFGVAFLQAPRLFVQIDRAFVNPRLLAADLGSRRGRRFARFLASAFGPLMGKLGPLLRSLGPIVVTLGNSLVISGSHR
jgi:hypothetical protein